MIHVSIMHEIFWKCGRGVIERVNSDETPYSLNIRDSSSY